jgi:hypothetical protein
LNASVQNRIAEEIDHYGIVAGNFSVSLRKPIVKGDVAESFYSLSGNLKIFIRIGSFEQQCFPQSELYSQKNFHRTGKKNDQRDEND